ncbi:Allyl alcohol dehydrogenase-like protein [Quillaja saponaria]|uniref:Allyl alcohol dehydrogenase-like protein n=1 Tax=Quillaja saponaria TaxID=32244 RepID=A0AAD7P7E3_QUISA|nr:Allyl alcohol dehydrogenase-like protein [Quillaja saponaria]KAJ7944640.1 Allyl alcohol dehydrogenase-like protein [Quillaja saponaria]
MGVLSWWRGKPQQPEAKSTASTNGQPRPAEVPGMNGAVEVPRPANITVFEFGLVAVSADKVTLAGYCPVSEELEPCRWEILPASGSDAPQFRVVF